jgi:hypothetical protein
MGLALAEGIARTGVGAAYGVTGTHHIAIARTHRHAGAHRMTGAGTAAIGGLLIRLGDVNFAIRDLDFSRCQDARFVITLAALQQSIIGFLAHGSLRLNGSHVIKFPA